MDISKLADKERNIFHNAVDRFCKQRKIEDKGVVYFVLENKLPSCIAIFVKNGEDPKEDFASSKYDEVFSEYQKADVLCRERIKKMLSLCVANERDQQYGLADVFAGFYRYAKIFCSLSDEKFNGFLSFAVEANTVSDTRQNCRSFAEAAGIDPDELINTIEKAEAEFYS